MPCTYCLLLQHMEEGGDHYQQNRGPPRRRPFWRRQQYWGPPMRGRGGFRGSGGMRGPPRGPGREGGDNEAQANGAMMNQGNPRYFRRYYRGGRGSYRGGPPGQYYQGGEGGPQGGAPRGYRPPYRRRQKPREEGEKQQQDKENRDDTKPASDESKQVRYYYQPITETGP